jgi:hypothetical protein
MDMPPQPITLARLALAAKRERAARRRADEALAERNRMIVELSRGGVPHRVIAESAELSLPAVGKVTRDVGGIIRWRRSSNPSPRRRAPVDDRGDLAV